MAEHRRRLERRLAAFAFVVLIGRANDPPEGLFAIGEVPFGQDPIDSLPSQILRGDRRV